MPRQLWPMERRGSGGQLQAGGSGEGEEEARDGGVHDPAGEAAVAQSSLRGARARSRASSRPLRIPADEQVVFLAFFFGPLLLGIYIYVAACT